MARSPAGLRAFNADAEIEISGINRFDDNCLRHRHDITDARPFQLLVRQRLSQELTGFGRCGRMRRCPVRRAVGAGRLRRVSPSLFLVRSIAGTTADNRKVRPGRADGPRRNCSQHLNPGRAGQSRPNCDRCVETSGPEWERGWLLGRLNRHLDGTRRTRCRFAGSRHCGDKVCCYSLRGRKGLECGAGDHITSLLTTAAIYGLMVLPFRLRENRSACGKMVSPGSTVRGR